MRSHHPAALAERLLAPAGTVRLFATTPPPARLPAEAMREAARAFSDIALRVAPDGLAVYDLQDERERNTGRRAYPFIPRHDALDYARAVTRACGLDAICFKGIGAMDEGEWHRLLGRAEARGIRLLVPVGRPGSPAPPGAMAITRSIELTAMHSARYATGSVVIAERDRMDGAELRRMLAKQAAGCAWFISQTVYDAPRTIGLLKLYSRECRRLGVRPRRIVLSFAPCGGTRTLDFMQWLGIAVPAGIHSLLASSRTPLSDSIRVCSSSFRRVLESVGELPLGFCAESFSSDRAQVEAAVDLFAALNEVLERPGESPYPDWLPDIAAA